jgi:hypothetical protein
MQKKSDPGWKKFGSGMEKYRSGIRDKNPGSATLLMVIRTMVHLKSIVYMIHRLGRLLPEVYKGVLVQDEGVREHVASKHYIFK